MSAVSLLSELQSAFAAAVAEVTGAPPSGEALVRAAGDPKFGDYQCAVAMSLARSLGQKPRELAERLREAVAPRLAELADAPEIAGAGFLNVRLRPAALARRLSRIPPGPPAEEAPPDADRCGIPPDSTPRRVVVDYSSPNIAKQMHVGHLRSTIIGDVFVRVLGFMGHDVIRQNHVGDWGTAIGMVVLGYWYVQARFHRGETTADIEERLRSFQVAPGESLDRLDALGRRICDEWSADLADPALDEFYRAPMTLDELELGYRFVQALTGIAQRMQWRVRNRPGGAEGEWESLADIPRKVTLMLQLGGPRNEPERRAWQQAREVSLTECQAVYDRLGVLLTPADVCGESFYEGGQRLPRAVAELRAALSEPGGRTGPDGRRAEFRTDQGAECIYLYEADGRPRARTPEGEPLPMIVQKSDGAYLYATTDLAALRYRTQELEFPRSGGRGAERIIYVTDPRQKLHFELLFDVSRIVGWAGPGVVLEHATFGSVLGEDKKPLKTRDGRGIKLRELLDEAERRALAVLEARSTGAADADAPEPDAPEPIAESPAEPAAARRAALARRIGVAAVKYADLARDRNTDYVFSWDKMLALQGDTAPYLLYAYARIRSIQRKAADAAGLARDELYDPAAELVLAEPRERALALRLARLHEVIEGLAADLYPHVLCAYLYDLAADFMRFYENCPVLEAPDEATRRARLRLCDLTARALRLGLGLLGIETLTRM